MPRPRENADRILTPAEKQARYRERQAKTRQEEQERKGLPTAAPIPRMPSAARWTAMQTHARELLDKCRAEMQEYFDERSEQWQESEKAEQLQERIEKLESIISDLGEA